MGCTLRTGLTEPPLVYTAPCFLGCQSPPVSLLAFSQTQACLQCLTVSTGGPHTRSRKPVHLPHHCWSTASRVARFTRLQRLFIISGLFSPSRSVFFLMSLAAQGKIKSNILLQPPCCASYAPPLSIFVQNILCALQQPADELWLDWTLRLHALLANVTAACQSLQLHGEADGQQTGARLCHSSGRDGVMPLRSGHPDKRQKFNVPSLRATASSVCGL